MKKKDKGEFKAEEMVENVEEFDTLGDIQRLIHELKIHQVELEIQNEELRQTQVELADSRDRYYDLFDFAPVGYFTIGKEGIIEEINLTACKMFGVDRSKTHKMKSFTDFVDDSDTHKYLDLKDTIFIKKKATSLELTLKKKNDDLLHVQISSSYFFDEQQNRDFMRSAIINITAQKAAELALQESEEKFRILSDRHHTG
jgi:chemotaxis family two-component system sensor kinase Cph1